MGYSITINLEKVGGILPNVTVEKRNSAKIIKSVLENAGAVVTVVQTKEVDFTPKPKTEKKSDKKTDKKK
jgi:hypothetical protein